MKLKDYLQETETGVREFARQIKVQHSQVIRWMKGQTPSLKHAKKIHAATLGVVGFDDF